MNMNESFIYYALDGADPAFLEASFEYRRDVRLKFLSDIAAAALSVFLFAFVFNAEYQPAPTLPIQVETTEKNAPAMLPENTALEFILPKKEETET